MRQCKIALSQNFDASVERVAVHCAAGCSCHVPGRHSTRFLGIVCDADASEWRDTCTKFTISLMTIYCEHFSTYSLALSLTHTILIHLLHGGGWSERRSSNSAVVISFGTKCQNRAAATRVRRVKHIRLSFLFQKLLLQTNECENRMTTD